MFDSHMSFKIHPKMGVWLWECGLASLAKKILDIYRLGLTLMFHAIFVKNRSYVAGGLAWPAHLTKLPFFGNDA